MKLYPFLFESNLHSIIWGGNKIAKWKGLPDEGKPIGESWEVSAVPSSVNIIANGTFRGRNLVSVINELPEEILGKAVARQYNNQLPLLAKFIDAQRDLSIQVHPNDEMAKRLHGKRGKTEMWYIIDAKPGAFLYAGFSKPMAHDENYARPENRAEAVEEYRRRIADGTITEVLAKHEVKAGDVFYLPAGRVHAIGSGILLAEIQQSSDVTYRIFDYNRPGMDGKPRELHTEQAAEALDYKVKDNYRTEYTYQKGKANPIVESSFFNVCVTDVDGIFHHDLKACDSFVILMCMYGDCRIQLKNTDEEVALKEGYSALIPASVADFEIIADNKEKKSQLLEAYIDNSNTL